MNQTQFDTTKVKSRNRNKKTFWGLVFVAAFAIGYQNCGSGFGVQDLDSSGQTVAESKVPLEGVYETAYDASTLHLSSEVASSIGTQNVPVVEGRILSYDKNSDSISVSACRNKTDIKGDVFISPAVGSSYIVGDRVMITKTCGFGREELRVNLAALRANSPNANMVQIIGFFMVGNEFYNGTVVNLGSIERSTSGPSPSTSPTPSSGSPSSSTPGGSAPVGSAPVSSPAPGTSVPVTTKGRLPSGYICFTTGRCGHANGQGTYCLYQAWNNFLADSKGVYQNGVNPTNYLDMATGNCAYEGQSSAPTPDPVQTDCKAFSANRWVPVTSLNIAGGTDLRSVKFQFPIAAKQGQTVSLDAVAIDDASGNYSMKKFSAGAYTCQANGTWAQRTREIIELYDKQRSESALTKPKLPAGFYCFTSGSCGYANGGGHYCLFTSWDKFSAASRGTYRSNVNLAGYADVSDGICR